MPLKDNLPAALRFALLRENSKRVKLEIASFDADERKLAKTVLINTFFGAFWCFSVLNF